MTQTSSAKVEWNAGKKHWQVVIQVGAEVIRRQCADTPQGVGISIYRGPPDAGVLLPYYPNFEAFCSWIAN